MSVNSRGFVKICIAAAAFALFACQIASAADQSQLIEQGTYVNKSGQEVHRPAHSKTGAAPDGATAKCRDGTYSFSTHHSGTCSRHGGVATWLN